MESFWIVIAGVGLFLLGMNLLEESLRTLAGRSFKLFLKRQTANRLKAVTGGAALTAVLQGSSVVNLLVLAFAGAGVLPMNNALAVLLGSNLGTTLDSWVVATLGFQAGLEQFAFPIAGISGLLRALSSANSRLRTASTLALGIGLLFIGLGFMKSSMEEMNHVINLARWEQAPLVLYLLAGLVITLIVQSSFATVALVLSLLHVSGIAFLPAAAVVLGAEVGTTGKMFLASLKGVPVKKRLALGNFLINFITVLVVMAALRPLTHWIQQGLGIHNPLIALVSFQSMVNVISILIFFPFLGHFGRFLEKQYRRNEEETLFIHKVRYSEAPLAIEALGNESRYFLLQVAAYGLKCFADTEKDRFRGHLPDEFMSKPATDQYEHIKHQYGTIHNYFLSIQRSLSDTEEARRLDRYMAVVRNGMYAAKSMKDARYDEQLLRNSSNDIKYGYYLKTRSYALAFYGRITELLLPEARPASYGEVVQVYNDMAKGYVQDLQGLYLTTGAGGLNETEISTLINYNRELYTAYKSMVLALKDCLLSGKDAEYFEDLPGFIR